MDNPQWPLEGEKEKAAQALADLPEAVRKFYTAEYQIEGALPSGSFVGLACKVCRLWREFAHSEDCPVKDLEPKIIDITL